MDVMRCLPKAKSIMSRRRFLFVVFAVLFLAIMLVWFVDADPQVSRRRTVSSVSHTAAPRDSRQTSVVGHGVPKADKSSSVAVPVQQGNTGKPSIKVVPKTPTGRLILSAHAVTIVSGSTMKSGRVGVISSDDTDISAFAISSANEPNLFSVTSTKKTDMGWELEIGAMMYQGVKPGNYSATLTGYGPNRSIYHASLTVVVVGGNDVTLDVYANFPANGDIKRIDVVIQRFNGNTTPLQGLSFATTPSTACSQSFVSGVNTDYESHVFYCRRSSSTLTSFTAYGQITIGGRNIIKTIPFSY